MLREALIIVFGFILGYSIDWVWARVVRGFKLEKKHYKKMIVGSIRIHHNIIGYVFIIIGFFFYTAFFVSLGIGMIIGHRIRDRFFWFVEFVK